MSKPTVASVDAKLRTHEEVCAERWAETLARIKKVRDRFDWKCWGDNSFIDRTVGEVMVDPVTVVTGAVAGLKLANSAFEQVKNLLENGKSIADAGSALSKYFTGVSAIEKEANSVGPGSQNSTSRAIEILAARQKIREQRQFLREFLQLKGPSGAWEEFLQIEREFRLANKKAKEDAEKARRAKVTKLKNIAAAALIVFGILLVIGIGVVVYLNIADAEALNVPKEITKA